MGYDGAGNLAWSASGLPSGTACSSDGNTTAINARKAARTYDARNRIATLSFPDLNGNQSWSYTPDGLPATVTTYNDGGASSVVNSYLYNKRRLPVSETQQVDSLTSSVGYGYDVNGHLSTLIYPDGLAVAYAPNALGQPTQAGSYATGVTYYPNGAIEQFTYGNGIVHTLTQNARGLPDRSRDLNGTTSVHDDSYDYDQVGNVLAISDAVSGNRGDRDMVYDDLNRLTSATSPMFGTATYAYDVLDNLRHVTVTGGTQVRDQDYVYDQNNRLTNITAGGATVVGLGYDVQGNLANKSGVNYTFDYGNRMRAGGPETYRYDVQGRRVRSNSSAGLIYSLYAQSGQLLFQRNERSGKRQQYIYLGGSLVAESAVPLAGGTATVTYQHTDALGSPVAVTNSAKTVLQRSEYEPYGYLLNRPMEDGPGYTGHVTDAATGLVYMQQRYYDPLCGCFLSVDQVTAYGGDYRYFNRYAYAFYNPYRFTDPNGRSAVLAAPALCVGPQAAGCVVVVVVATAAASCAASAGCRDAVENTVESITSGIKNAANALFNEEAPSDNESEEGGNTNPYDGPVDEPVIVVDGDGNAIPVGEGEQVSSSPNGNYQQVKDRSGKPTGTRIDRGGHKGHADPQAQGPHGHRPGVTDETGNPHLPIQPPKKPPVDPEGN